MIRVHRKLRSQSYKLTKTAHAFLLSILKIPVPQNSNVRMELLNRRSTSGRVEVRASVSVYVPDSANEPSSSRKPPSGGSSKDGVLGKQPPAGARPTTRNLRSVRTEKRVRASQ